MTRANHVWQKHVGHGGKNMAMSCFSTTESNWTPVLMQLRLTARSSILILLRMLCNPAVYAGQTIHTTANVCSATEVCAIESTPGCSYSRQDPGVFGCSASSWGDRSPFYQYPCYSDPQLRVRALGRGYGMMRWSFLNSLIIPAKSPHIGWYPPALSQSALVGG